MSAAPFQFAQDLTAQVNEAWGSGELRERVTDTTRTLLDFWFDERFCELRPLNFHIGQEQAIKNVIYCQEVLKATSILDVYQTVAPDLALGDGALEQLSREKFQHPKYAVKMATGTGKTWVLDALLIWQYLNAQAGEEGYTKNFLIIAPGLIVYERLLDAFLGKVREEDGSRNFETSDIYSARELFLPDTYRDEVFRFIQTAAVRKEEIGARGGEGVIAITNWHLLVEEQEDIEEEVEAPGELEPSEVLDAVLPVRPGKAAGNDLSVLDRSIYRSRAISYLKDLPDLMLFNDEAHHLAETQSGGEVVEKKWQESITAIAEGKGARFTQVDFSATPYKEVRNTKHYFPHIVVDLDLKTAIHKGLVKSLVLDKRSDITAIAAQELDFKAERDEEGTVVGLSEGQRLMLRAGLTKLRTLDVEFSKLAQNGTKHPKMLVMCEDTKVAPYVAAFLRDEGLSEDDILEVHTDRKGNLSGDEWERVRERLFNLDRHEQPKVVVSVLMLREGFDVSNVCVIVPLRATQAPILLEQTIGRGLRQMWREPEFREMKEENRRRLLQEHLPPANYIDILSVVEHPAFEQFYEELMEGDYGIDDGELGDGSTVTGDMLTVALRPDFERFDFHYPIVLQESEHSMEAVALSPEMLAPFYQPFDTMKAMVGQGERFRSTDMTSGTRFGDYRVEGGIMTATSYNDFLGRLITRVGTMLAEPVSGRHTKAQTQFPVMQVNQAQLAALSDQYIRTRLFEREVDPLANENWRVLLVEAVINHVLQELAKAVTKLQEGEVTSEPIVSERQFSEVDELRMRESCSLETSKTVYERSPFPCRNGGFERAFIEYLDTDGSVDAFAKVIEHKHMFLRQRYLREDGVLSFYMPDFLVRCSSDTYIVETKNDEQTSHPNVERKKTAALRAVERINALPEEMRRHTTWHYTLVSESVFYGWRDRGASVRELLEFAKLHAKNHAGHGQLF